MELSDFKQINHEMLDQAYNGLSKGYNPEDWSVFSQGLDNLKDICKIESMDCCEVNELRKAYLAFEEDRTEANLKTMLEHMGKFVTEMKSELTESERAIVKASLQSMITNF